MGPCLGSNQAVYSRTALVWYQTRAVREYSLTRLVLTNAMGFFLRFVSLVCMDVIRLGSNGCGQSVSLWTFSDWPLIDVVRLDPFGCFQTGSLCIMTHSVPMDVVGMGIY